MEPQPVHLPPSSLPARRVWTRRAVVAAIAAVPVAGAAWAIEDALSGGSDSTPPRPRPRAANAGRPSRRHSISEENARPGSTAWRVPQDESVWRRVRGFASRTSVNTGEAFDLFVSTQARSYTVTAYRMGYYGGAGGRRVWTSGPLRGQSQPPPRIDRATNMRDAPWARSLTIHADESWVPGSYLLVLESDDGGRSQVPIVIRDDSDPAPVHIQHDVTTWQAYNLWGGASLYQGEGGRSTVVSFDRPYGLSGSGNFLGGVHEVAALVESLGLEVTYSTSLDTHARPADARRHKVWISPAHDEYWSLEMRDGIEAARDAGTNLLFCGANCMFRRIRLEDSDLGPNRHEVNYRVASLDPLNGKDPARVTTSWREPPGARPESSIIGNFYESNPVSGDAVIVDAGAWMFQGTGVRNGDRWPGIIGNEYDRVTPEVPTPANIEVLAHSPVRCRGRNRYADMTYYTAASGAGVFSAGTIWFERHLFPARDGVDRQIQQMVTNMLQAMALGPVGSAHPSRSNLAELGIHAGYLPPMAGES